MLTKGVGAALHQPLGNRKDNRARIRLLRSDLFPRHVIAMPKGIAGPCILRHLTITCFHVHITLGPPGAGSEMPAAAMRSSTVWLAAFAAWIVEAMRAKGGVAWQTARHTRVYIVKIY